MDVQSIIFSFKTILILKMCHSSYTFKFLINEGVNCDQVKTAACRGVRRQCWEESCVSLLPAFIHIFLWCLSLVVVSSCWACKVEVAPCSCTLAWAPSQNSNHTYRGWEGWALGEQRMPTFLSLFSIRTRRGKLWVRARLHQLWAGLNVSGITRSGGGGGVGGENNCCGSGQFTGK